jgi:hypothetical protein
MRAPRGAAKLVASLERRPVETNLFRLRRRHAHLGLERRLPVASGQPHTCRRLAEADEPGLGSRPRREPLRPDVQPLEQVRLPHPVRARHQHDSGIELELELGVGAEVSERDVLDDQPASLIGMIR